MLSFESATVGLGICLSYTVYSQPLALTSCVRSIGESWIRRPDSARGGMLNGVCGGRDRGSVCPVTEIWRSATSSGSLGHSSSSEEQDGRRRF